MFDIITFGSATSDTFLKLKKNSQYVFGHGGKNEICFPLGSKITVEGLKVYSGGGGTNTVISFANFGLKTNYVGKIGDDAAGALVTHDLRKAIEKPFRLRYLFLIKDNKHYTASSVILSADSGDRTVLIRRGACHHLIEKEIPFHKIEKTKWFYLAPLSGQSANVFTPLVQFAKEHKIKVMANLGNSQLKLKKKQLQEALSQIDVLLLNEEEAVQLSGQAQENEVNVLTKIREICPGIIVVTKGSKGAVVLDGDNFYQAKSSLSRSIEKTGAGDAFGSGFLTGLFLKNNIEYAIQVATANASSCIQQIGAKNGLLSKKDLMRLPKVVINKTKFNNF